MNKKIGCRILVSTVGVLLAQATFPHHSNAMFDSTKQVTLQGTVKEFQFTNPHCWIQLLIANGSDAEEWSIEMGAPTHLIRSGWKPGTLKPGDKITVVINPMRDGSKGGNYVAASGLDGKAVEARP